MNIREIKELIEKETDKIIKSESNNYLFVKNKELSWDCEVIYEIHIREDNTFSFLIMVGNTVFYKPENKENNIIELKAFLDVEITYKDLCDYCLKLGFKIGNENCVFYEEDVYNIDIAITKYSEIIINNSMCKKRSMYQIYQIVKNIME